MKQERNYFIDFFKFIASLVIVVYHGWQFAGSYGNGYFNRGYFAVDFYFIVSGYLMMNSIYKKKDEKTTNFLKKKIKNFFPYILSAFIIGVIFQFGIHKSTLNVFISNSSIIELFQLGVLIPGNFIINGSAWYISAMLVTFSILYPIAKKYKEKYNEIIAPILLIIFITLVYNFNINVNDPASKTIIFSNGLYKSFIFLLIGNIIYKTNYTKTLSKTKKFIITIIELFLYLIIFLNYHYELFDTIIEAILTTTAISISFSNKSYTYDIFNNKILQRLSTRLSHFGFILYLNNTTIRPFINTHVIGSYKYKLLIYLEMVFMISIITYFVIPIILKITTKLKKKVFQN